jgi:hypothetical protein
MKCWQQKQQIGEIDNHELQVKDSLDANFKVIMFIMFKLRKDMIGKFGRELVTIKRSKVEIQKSKNMILQIVKL